MSKHNIQGVSTMNKKQVIESVHQRIKQFELLVHQDPFRLAYHLMPPVGLLNDPNGFIQFNGRYHLFYQWNPFATSHGAKFWGHYSSSNLVEWVEEEIALTPTDAYDRNGCYSGSAIEHNEKLYLFYTGNVKRESTRETYQCLAISSDGIQFEKKGPILHLPEGFTPHFRDPKVWKQGNTWFMVIGAQDIMEQGCVVLFSSRDLYNWNNEGVIAGSNRQGLGDHGYMWECPDLFSVDGQDVLLVSPQGMEAQGFQFNNLYQSGYFIGKLDLETKLFQHGSFQELDRGFDFYAPQTTEDSRGRRLLFAWMGITDSNEALHPTIANGWVHAMTLPRELIVKDNKLLQQPVSELTLLRKNGESYRETVVEDETIQLSGVQGAVLELELNQFQFDTKTSFTIEFRKYARLTFNAVRQEMILERKRLTGDGMEKRGTSLISLTSLHIFLDRSSIEIFVNDGEETFTARIFPDPNEERIEFASRGKVRFDLNYWELSSFG